MSDGDLIRNGIACPDVDLEQAAAAAAAAAADVAPNETVASTEVEKWSCRVSCRVSCFVTEYLTIACFQVLCRPPSSVRYEIQSGPPVTCAVLCRTETILCCSDVVFPGFS